MFLALKGTSVEFLFDITADGVVPCGGLKTSTRTSSIAQIIFYICNLRSEGIF